MPFETFHTKFPEIADRETRSITILNNPELPSDSYGLLEAYCNEEDCDCRRVFFHIMSEKKNKIVAVISFGWESKKFYADWMEDNDSQMIEDLIGPVLNLTSPQSKLAPKLLELVENVVLKDKKYVQRLKVHYKLFRDQVDESFQNNEIEKPNGTIYLPPKVGRNEPCPCGSGKKYKQCCLN